MHSNHSDDQIFQIMFSEGIFIMKLTIEDNPFTVDKNAGGAMST